MESILEIKSQIRDIQLEELTGLIKLKFDVSKRFNKKFQLWFPNRKLIKYLTKNGAILTGSRALKCYELNDKDLLSRSYDGSDWDFVVTKQMMYKISDECGIPYNLVDKIISIKKQKYWVSPAYSDSYRVGAIDVHLIIVDELPPFVESGGVRITPFTFTLNEKVKLLDEIVTNSKYSSSRKLQKEADKHQNDLIQIILKYNLNSLNK